MTNILPLSVYEDDPLRIVAARELWDDSWLGNAFKTAALVDRTGRFRSPEHAEFIVRAVNYHQVLLRALANLVTVVDGSLQGYGLLEKPMREAREALAKAESMTRIAAQPPELESYV